MSKILHIREEWLKNIHVDKKDEKLFELEMLLRALDRFFHVRNLPFSDMENIVLRNFHSEMKIVSMAVDRCVYLLQTLLPPEDANMFNFQMYLENTLLLDYARDKFILQNIRQNHPKESLFLMLLAFINLSVLIKLLLNQKHIPYIAFHHTGQIISREMAVNRFFNPLEAPVFSPRFDRISNRYVKKVYSEIKNEKLRSLYTVITVALFRFLKYLEYVDQNTPSKEMLKFYILHFALLKSEVYSLINFIELDGSERIKSLPIPDSEKTKYLEVFDSIAFQIDMESKKVFRQVLRDALDENRSHQIRSMIDSAKGIQKNIFEQSIVTLVQSIDPGVQGSLIFPDFVSRFEQSVRLREDMFIFIKLIERIEKSLDRTADDDAIPQHRVLSVLRDYISYFSNLSFNYVRYADAEEFIDFFNFALSLKDEDLKDRKKLTECRLRLHTFRTFLETTLNLIQQRAELHGVPLDEEHAMEIMRQFV